MAYSHECRSSSLQGRQGSRGEAPSPHTRKRLRRKAGDRTACGRTQAQQGKRSQARLTCGCRRCCAPRPPPLPPPWPCGPPGHRHQRCRRRSLQAGEGAGQQGGNSQDGGAQRHTQRHTSLRCPPLPPCGQAGRQAAEDPSSVRFVSWKRCTLQTCLAGSPDGTRRGPHGSAAPRARICACGGSVSLVGIPSSSQAPGASLPQTAAAMASSSLACMRIQQQWRQAGQASSLPAFSPHMKSNVAFVRGMWKSLVTTAMRLQQRRARRKLQARASDRGQLRRAAPGAPARQGQRQAAPCPALKPGHSLQARTSNRRAGRA